MFLQKHACSSESMYVQRKTLRTKAHVIVNRGVFHGRADVQNEFRDTNHFEIKAPARQEATEEAGAQKCLLGTTRRHAEPIVRVFYLQSRRRSSPQDTTVSAPILIALINDLCGDVFVGEELHPPRTYGVTVVSRSIKAAA